VRKDGLRALAERGAGLDGWVRNYLSARHRDNPGSGCFTSALVAEVARHPEATRDAFTDKLTTIIGLIACQLPAGTADARRRDATALYGMLVGTLQLARAITDKDLSDEILANGISAALALIGPAEPARPSVTR
jgi:TetR/AcrR family transcriptional repressor of nem operon